MQLLLDFITGADDYFILTMKGKAEVTSELGKRLARAGSNDVLEVLVTFRPGEHAVAASADDSQSAVARATEASGEAPRDITVYKNLGTALLAAPPKFIEALKDQPAVAKLSARPGPQEPTLIRPVHKQIVSPQELEENDE